MLEELLEIHIGIHYYAVVILECTLETSNLLLYDDSVACLGRKIISITAFQGHVVANSMNAYLFEQVLLPLKQFNYDNNEMSL